MKCAKEINTIHEIAIAQHETEELKKDLVALEAHKVSCEKAIIFCEEVIAPRLESCAEHWTSKIVKASFNLRIYSDRLGNKHFDWMGKEYRKSGVKRINRRNYNTCTVDCYDVVIPYSNIDLETVISYLKKYCYNCNITSWTFYDTHVSHERDTKSGITLIVTSTPECE